MSANSANSTHESHFQPRSSQWTWSKKKREILPVVAPPGATFLPNPRSTVDFPQPVTGVQKIAKSTMFETVDGEMRNRLQRSPSNWGLPQTRTEGFWSKIPRAGISWSCGAH